MSKLLNFLLILYILNQVYLLPSCKEGVNNCQSCHPLTKLCTKCTLDIYSPDENGGCSPSGKCKIGKNYCLECDEQENKCSQCEPGLFPDENGACSFVDNCEISSKGFCLKCKSDFVLIGGEDIFRICKSKSSEDLLNCKTINSLTGLCDECELGYFLNVGDLRCSGVENCYESSFGKCASCASGYFLYLKENKCLSQVGAVSGSIIVLKWEDFIIVINVKKDIILLMIRVHAHQQKKIVLLEIKFMDYVKLVMEIII